MEIQHKHVQQFGPTYWQEIKVCYAKKFYSEKMA